MNSLCFSVAVVLALVSSALTACDSDFCASQICESMENCTGIVKAKGSECGCCDVCVPYRVEGESCIDYMENGQVHYAACEAGLHCNIYHTFTCVLNHPGFGRSVRDAKTCTSASRAHHSITPVCDADGYYQPKQCIGSSCFCVSKTGDHIDGYGASLDESTNMTCQCARDQYEYMQSGLIGKFFYCTPDGSYQN